MVFGLKWSFSCYQFIQCDSDSPHVHSLIVPSSIKHLWGSIVWGPSDSKHFSFVSSFHKFLANAKVDKLDLFFTVVI